MGPQKPDGNPTPEEERNKPLPHSHVRRMTDSDEEGWVGHLLVLLSPPSSQKSDKEGWIACPVGPQKPDGEPIPGEERRELLLTPTHE